MNTIQKLYKYCREQMMAVSENFDLHEELALQTIDQMRCPLSMADEWLYNRMTELIEEYCEDNGLDAEEYDTDEVFWEGHCEEEE